MDLNEPCQEVDFIAHPTGGIEWMTSLKWFEYLHRTTNGVLFPTRGTLTEFLLINREELIEMGAIIYRGGRGGTLVRRDFGRYALKILMRSRRTMTPGQRINQPMYEQPLKDELEAAERAAKEAQREEDLRAALAFREQRAAASAAPTFEDGRDVPNGVAA